MIQQQLDSLNAESRNDNTNGNYDVPNLNAESNHLDSLHNIISKPRKKRILFTQKEDSKIINAIKEYGEHNWRIVASFVPGRTERQCRERWNKFLCPTINHSTWTAEEDELLMRKFNEYGPKWSYLSRFFNNRTDVNLKTRYAIHLRKMKREQEFLSHYKLISKDAISIKISSTEKYLERKEKPLNEIDKKLKNNSSLKKNSSKIDKSRLDFENVLFNLDLENQGNSGENDFDDLSKFFNDIGSLFDNFPSLEPLF